jgi:hypothetical protein
LQAWLPGIFDAAALQEIRGGQVLHITRFTARNEDRVKAFASRRLLNPQAYRRRTPTPTAGSTAVRTTAFVSRIKTSGRRTRDSEGWAPDFRWPANQEPQVRQPRLGLKQIRLYDTHLPAGSRQLYARGGGDRVFVTQNICCGAWASLCARPPLGLPETRGIHETR